VQPVALLSRTWNNPAMLVDQKRFPARDASGDVSPGVVAGPFKRTRAECSIIRFLKATGRRSCRASAPPHQFGSYAFGVTQVADISESSGPT
jgi:hypothetical protein